MEGGFGNEGLETHVKSEALLVFPFMTNQTFVCLFRGLCIDILLHFVVLITVWWHQPIAFSLLNISFDCYAEIQ